MINTFYLDAESAEAYGLIMLAPPDHVVAERDIERKEVPGRSGDVIIDNGRYKNVTVKYSCAILPEDGVPYRTTVARAVQFLKSGPAYKQLRNTYDPDRFGYTLDLGDLGNKLLAVVNAVFAVLSILGIVTDPTTAGIGDSPQAMTYEEPKQNLYN